MPIDEALVEEGLTTIPQLLDALYDMALIRNAKAIAANNQKQTTKQNKTLLILLGVERLFTTLKWLCAAGGANDILIAEDRGEKAIEAKLKRKGVIPTRKKIDDYKKQHDPHHTANTLYILSAFASAS